MGRVLPAPAAGWRHGATNWFCCVNRLDRAPDLALRETDLLYGPATCSLHRAALPSLVVATNDDDSDSDSNDKDRLRVGTCRTCGVEIGTLVEEAVECEYAALRFLQWDSCADDVTDNGRDVTTDPQLSGKPISGGKISDKDASAPAVHPAGASWGANFLAYLASRVQEAPELMPKLALSPRGKKRTDRLHLWIADRQLTILRSCAEADQLTVSTVSKVLFKLSAAGGKEEEEIVEEVSERLYRGGLALLQDSCRHFPDTVRTFQDYSVAYLSLL